MENFLKQQNARQILHPMAHPKDMVQNAPYIMCKADDIYITDIDGNRLLDAVSGLWNVNLGYDAPSIKSAITQQLDIMPYTSIFRGQACNTSIVLAEQLIAYAKPENMQRVFYTQGGSDSIDTALRLARQYWKIQGKGEKFKFLSLKNGYHGTHMGGASINGNPQFRQAYEPLLPGCIHLSAPWLYRNPFGATDEDTLCDLLIAELENEIQFQGAHTIAAMIGEPVLGAGGVIVPPKNYWKRVQQVCNTHDILLIADEVIGAFGRTGAEFGCRTFGYTPDMICFAKAVTNGFFPLGGVLLNKKCADIFTNNDSPLGVLSHGYTNSGNPVGCAAAIATLDMITEIQPHKNAKIVGAYLKSELEKNISTHPNVGDIRGKGLMVSIEFVTDKTRKKIDKNMPLALGKACYEKNIWVRVSGPYIILSPPLIITTEHVDKIVQAITNGLSQIS